MAKVAGHASVAITIKRLLKTLRLSLTPRFLRGVIFWTPRIKHGNTALTGHGLHTRHAEQSWANRARGRRYVYSWLLGAQKVHLCYNRNFSPALKNVVRINCLYILAYRQEAIGMFQYVLYQATRGILSWCFYRKITEGRSAPPFLNSHITLHMYSIGSRPFI